MSIRDERPPQPPSAAATAPSGGLASHCPVCLAVRREREELPLVVAASALVDPRSHALLAIDEQFCALHWRVLLSDRRSWDVLPQVVVSSLRVAAQRLRAENLSNQWTCSACQREVEVTDASVASIRRTVVGSDEASRSLGILCPSHLDALLDPLAPYEASLVLRDQVNKFRRSNPALVIHELALDRDFVEARPAFTSGAVVLRRRRRWFKSSGTALRDLVDLLEVNACPACSFGAEEERRYLCFARTRRSQGRRFAPLCSHHLCQLGQLSPRRAAAELHEMAIVTLGGLQLQFEALSVDIRHGERRSLARGWWVEAHDRAFVVGPRRPFCPACTVRDVAEQHVVNLVLFGVRYRAIAGLYARSHGLCERHIPVLSTPATRLVRDELIGRVDLASFMLALATRCPDPADEHSDFAHSVCNGISFIDGGALANGLTVTLRGEGASGGHARTWSSPLARRLGVATRSRRAA